MSIVIFIAGEKDAGKSSVIKALTGIHGNKRTKYCKVEIKDTSNSIIKVFVLIDSLQEKVVGKCGLPSAKKVTPKEFVAFVQQKRKEFDLFLVPSWHDGNLGLNNSLVDFVDALMTVNITVDVFGLDGLSQQKKYSKYKGRCKYYVVKKDVINAMAHEVRKKLKWL